MHRKSISNYRCIEKLGESPHAVTYKGFHKENPHKTLIIKVLKLGHLSEHQKIHFRQKIEQLKVLNDPMLIRPLAFKEREDKQFIIREYFNGIPLDQWRKAQQKVSLKDFFIISCFLAKALDKVHEAGIVHGGIKPHNILIHPKSLTLRLIDFIAPLDVREASYFIYEEFFVRGTLAYTSSEQTGRINHRVGFSSDLYSLGIILYELLTGKLPFFSLDPLELIHSHLAQEAVSVSKLASRVPKMVSKIIAKLILKQPEKRYQSGRGLVADLKRCYDEYTKRGKGVPFPLGKYDYTHRITFVSKMVGRSEETKVVLNEYNCTTDGSFRAIFISGLPGIGKTRLIQELQRPIVENKGYFISGKFDIYQKNIPYSALIQSLKNLIRTFLTESDNRVDSWRRRIVEAVGINGRVMTEVIPELEILIGPQEKIKPLPPVESRNRFNSVFSKFLTCLASKENPLTLFIDDLQWCDAATFDFFENLFSDYQSYKYLFFIGAYRHNEVSAAHPLAKLICNIKENKQPLKRIRLNPLDAKYCHEMIAYILNSSLLETKEISAFICGLSEGNPLFVSEILSYLHNENLLFLDNNKHWQWNLDKIRQSDMPSNVVSLFSAKVKKLPALTINLLEYCACMGNLFSPAVISMVKDSKLSDIFEILKTALAQGLLMESKDDFQFVHDRVQEAVLTAIAPNRKREIHWAIGRHLLSAAKDKNNLQESDDIFSIASHLNLGKPKRLDIKYRYILSDINYYAGNKALNALATEAAKEYFRQARELLSENCWELQYDKTFKIYQKAAKTELMCGDYNISEKLLDGLLTNAKTNLDRAECLAEQTTSLSSIGNFIKAIETANRGLEYFNKAIPMEPKKAEKRCEGLMSELEAKNINIWNKILNMPFTSERESKIELAFYSELIPDLYMSGLVPQLYLSAVMSTLHCLAGGMDESVIYSFTIMALYLGEREEFKKAFKYEDLARNLSAKYPNTFGATRGMNGIVWCNMHSRSHPEEIVSYCQKAIQCGKNSGDLYNAGLSYGPLMWNLQVQGSDFTKIEEYADECLEFSNKYQLYFSVRLAEAIREGWIEPMKREYVSADMESKIKIWEKDNHISSAGSYYVHRGLVHYYFGEYEEAEYYLQKVRRYLKGLTDNVLKRQWYVFLVLNAIRLHKNKIKYKSKKKLFEYIKPLIKKIKTWAALGPLLRPYLILLYAELEMATGDLREARSLYLDALDLAANSRYHFLEGYLNECLGEFIAGVSSLGEFCLEYQTCDKRKCRRDRWWICLDKERGEKQEQFFRSTAGVFLKQAAFLYKKVQAKRKEAVLLEKYSKYFKEEPLAPLPVIAKPAHKFSNIDTDYLMKSCLVIPVETEEKVLLHKIMNVVLESSGAQNGYLIIEESGDLIIRAESHITEKHIVRTTARDLGEYKNICHAIVRYVYRSQEVVLLENASEKGKFKDSLEVQALKLKSVLCLPVIKQNRLIGILYLENSLADSVFTPERTELTKFFTYQTAISWENARLIEKMKQAESDLQEHREHLEEMVEARTNELRQAQKNLIVAERLAVLGQLSGSISHEIRNPLNVISSSAYYLKLKLPKADKKISEHIQRIEVEIKNSIEIIDSLLSLSGMKEPQKKPLKIHSIIDDVVIASQIPKEVRLIKKLPKAQIFVNVDKGQLYMAFYNIIKNSLEAMNGKGVFTIEAGKKGRGSIEILFKDTGTGIIPENINKIFQPLFTTKARGIGFGLSICKMIIQKHEGTIAVTSDVGKGTVVVVRLPLGKK